MNERLTTTLKWFSYVAQFFINTIKGIQNEDLFPRKNIKFIFVAALLIFLQTIASDNLSQAFIAKGPAVIGLSSNPFVQSLVILIFGILYKMAHQVAAEQMPFVRLWTAHPLIFWTIANRPQYDETT